MCKLMEDLTAELFKEELVEGRAEAEKTTLLENIRDAMESWDLTVEAMIKGFKISEKKQKELLPLI